MCYFSGDDQEVGITRPEGAGVGVAFEEVGEVAESPVVEGLVGVDQYSVFDWEPVKVVEVWGDMVYGSGSCEEVGSRVLYVMKGLKSFFETAVIESVILC